jgi:hypothetical protein
MEDNRNWGSRIVCKHFNNTMKYLMTIASLIWASDISAQTYHPFLELNKNWTVEVVYYMHIPPIIHQITYTYLGDTVINSVEYKNYGTIIREDTIQKRVYLWYDGYPNDECLLYDFNAQAGDTIEACNFFLIIDSVSTIHLLNGEIRNIFFYSGTITGEYYIEGIGSNEGFEFLSEPIGEPGFDLMCVKKDGIELFGDRCDQVIGLQELPCVESYVKLFPNPVSGYLNIECSEDIETFCIIDLMGRNLLHGTVNSNKINLSHLLPGHYIIVFRNHDNIIVDSQAIIIN